jgi:hypothetical protein
VHDACISSNGVSESERVCDSIVDTACVASFDTTICHDVVVSVGFVFVDHVLYTESVLVGSVDCLVV